MTREEEIRQEINLQLAGSFGNYSEGCEEGFIEGAKWADEHPDLSEEELVGMGGLGMIWQRKTLLKKVYNWLDDNWYNYCGYTTFNGGLMIEDLKRETEE